MNPWHKGPPPSCGWWPAGRTGNPEIIRWWDGQAWSVGFWPSADVNSIPRLVKVQDPNQSTILWTERPFTWPKRSFT